MKKLKLLLLVCAISASIIGAEEAASSAKEKQPVFRLFSSDVPRYSGIGFGGYALNQYGLGDWAEFANCNLGLGANAEVTIPFLFNMDFGGTLRAEYAHVFPKAGATLKSDEEVMLTLGGWIRIPFNILSLDFAFQPELGYGFVFHNAVGQNGSTLNGVYTDQILTLSLAFRWIPKTALFKNLEIELSPEYTFSAEEYNYSLHQLGFRIGAVYHPDGLRISWQERQQAKKDAKEAAEKAKAEASKTTEPLPPEPTATEPEPAGPTQEQLDKIKAEEDAKKAAEEEAARKAEEERVAAEEKAAADKLAAEQAEADKLAAEQAEADKLAADKAAEEKAAADKLAEEEAARKAEEERLAAEKAEADRLAAEQAAAEAAEKARQAEIASWPAPTVATSTDSVSLTPDGDGLNDTAVIKLSADHLEDPTEGWTVAITDPKGNIFRTISGEGSLPSEITWDGLSDSGEKVFSRNTYVAKASANLSKKDSERTGLKTIESTVEIKTGLVLQVIVPEHEWKIVVNTISFDPDKETFDSLSEEQNKSNSETLDEVAEQIKSHPGANVIIEGYANNVSNTEKENTEELVPLSQKRAEVIVALLEQRGIEKGTLTAKGMGGANPLAEWNDKANWWKNRRVEFVIKQ